MKLKFPHLKRFKHDWACHELVIGALQNRQKAESAKVRSLVAKSPSKKKVNPSKRKGFKTQSTSVNLASTQGDAQGSVVDEEMMDE